MVTGEFDRALLTGRVFQPEFFDAITMYQVLDHLPDPLGSLRLAHRLLRPGGVAAMLLVNIESFCARVFGAGYRLLAPNHLYYFSPRTITAALAQAGFRVLRIDYPYFDTPYCNARELKTLLVRTFQALVWSRLTGSGEPVLSPPFYGNMMVVFAAKSEKVFSVTPAEERHGAVSQSI